MEGVGEIGAADDHVVAGAAPCYVLDLAPRDDAVVAAETVDDIVLLRAEEDVVAFRADNDVGQCRILRVLGPVFRTR
jgi:hypothetical protein